jgi:sugar O-acyltransferase (sialic acid O-acetyltransferase NeuD family)
VKPLFIFGTGGHARDVAELAAAVGYRPVFVTRDADELAGWQKSDELAVEGEVADRATEAFAIGIGDNRRRAAVAARYRDKLSFPTLIHPDTSLARDASAMLAKARGTALFPGVRIMDGCCIGDFCTLNLNVTMSHDCRLDDFANLSPGAHLAGHVHIGEGAWIGMGTVVNQGAAEAPRIIGAWATVGSGAAVIRDVPPRATQAGVPARDLRP